MALGSDLQHHAVVVADCICLHDAACTSAELYMSLLCLQTLYSIIYYDESSLLVFL